MSDWYRRIQAAVDAIDKAIAAELDDALTLEHLARATGYSPYHMTRMFRSLAGIPLRDYLRGRRLAFALVAVRDTDEKLLDIAVRYGFSSHEAFTRAFRALYGIAPGAYRKSPVPVVLRSKINPLDRYLIAKGVVGMRSSVGEIKIYYTRVPAHRFLHIKNYDSNGYFDFWEKQAAVAGGDCDTVCGLLDSIGGKLDGEGGAPGSYSGQIMGYPREVDGRRPEAYGVRLPADWAGAVPAGMQVLDVAEGEYIVFEHGPFDFETQCEAVYERLDETVEEFDWAAAACRPDDTAGRIAYYYNDPARFLKRVLPVKRMV